MGRQAAEERAFGFVRQSSRGRVSRRIWVLLAAVALTSGVVAGRASAAQPTGSLVRVRRNVAPMAGDLAMQGAAAVRQTEPINRWRGNQLVSLWRGDPARREIALTFDDGPHPAYTARLLDLLRGLHVHATFFLVGKKVDQAPEMVARIASEGHEVGNHTYHHINLDRLPDALIVNEIRLGNEAVKRACGVEPTCFRPPGGHHGEAVMRAAARLNMRTILWTDDPADFAKPGPEVIEGRVCQNVGAGSDILLHDGIEQTLQVLPDMVARLRRDGYHFVTISQMVQHLEQSRLVHR